MLIGQQMHALFTMKCSVHVLDDERAYAED